MTDFQTLARCPGFKKYKSDIERRKNPHSKGKEDPITREETNAAREAELTDGASSLVAESSIAAVVSLGTVEPGLVNPAFEEGEEGGNVSLCSSQQYLTDNTLNSTKCN